ncbi:MAG TPA: hypothetical protein VK841_09990 [Polyangiaceae bacterium]|jgi:hypothetical protein|nr:hypothetical protein [Polyangiaceae bacterium]
MATEVPANGDAGRLEDAGTPRGIAARDLLEAKAALRASPADRDVARTAFEAAIVADDDPMAVAEAYFRLGVLEEEDGAFGRALADQNACRAKAPTSNWGRSARLRIGWIASRSEGDFAPLARLQRARRNPAILGDPGALASLAHDAETFPPGRVRAEARMFVAESWLLVMNRRHDALEELRKVEDDPSSDSTDAVLAHGRLVDAFLTEGWLDEAEREIHSRPTDPSLTDRFQRLVFRRALRRAAIVGLSVLIAFAAIAAARAIRLRSSDASHRSRAQRCPE